MTQAVLADHRTAPVSAKVHAALELLEQVTLKPGEVTAEQVRPLKALGVSRAGVEQALWVAFCFNLITRMADALGWEVGDKAGFDAGAKVLLSRGYGFPFRTQP